MRLGPALHANKPTPFRVIAVFTDFSECPYSEFSIANAGGRWAIGGGGLSPADVHTWRRPPISLSLYSLFPRSLTSDGNPALDHTLRPLRRWLRLRQHAYWRDRSPESAQPGKSQRL